MTAANPGEYEDIERALLGGLLSKPDRILDVSEYVTPEMFRGQARRTIYEAIVGLNQRGQDCDLVSVKNEVERLRGEPVSGLIVAMTKLLDGDHTGQFVLSHARLLRGRYTLDRVRELGDDARERSLQVVPDEDHVQEFLDGLMSDLYGLTGTIRRQDQETIKSQVADVFRVLEQREGGVVGLRTGFYDLDERLYGLRPGQLIICAARPSMGKSAFATTLLGRMAKDSGHESGRPCRGALVTLEMNTQQVVTRMLAAESGVELDRIFRNRMDQAERGNLLEAATLVSDLPIWIDDSPGMNLTRLRAKMRRIQQVHGLDLIVVDYLQLMHGVGKSENRQNEVSKISRGLKDLARELQIPIIALSQLSRQVEARENKRPMLSDLRESGSLEQDADVVLLLYRPGYYKPDDHDPKKAELIVAKNRDGATGTVDLFFRGPLSRFDSASFEDMPQSQTDPIDF